MVGMAARRMPTGVVGSMKNCRLFAGGQKCSSCPNQGLHTCPIRDIEDCGLPLASGRCAQESRGVIRVEQRHQCHLHIATPSARPHQISALSGGRTNEDGFRRGRRMPGVGKAAVSTMTAAWNLDQADRSSAMPLQLVQRKAAEQVSEAVAALSLTSQVALDSEHGRELFTDALLEGNMESYFCIAEQAVNETDEGQNVASVLSMCLNALGHDPQRTWKGPWRWNTPEQMYLEGVNHHSASNHVITTTGFAALARSHGVEASAQRAQFLSEEGVSAFRNQVKQVASDATTKAQLVVNYAPAGLGLEGSARFSTVAGYNAASDMVLLLDGNRENNSPFWVSVSKMWAAMSVKHHAGGDEMGYVVLSSARADQLSVSEMCPLMLRSWARSRLDGCSIARSRPRGRVGRRTGDACGQQASVRAEIGLRVEEIRPKSAMSA